MLILSIVLCECSENSGGSLQLHINVLEESNIFQLYSSGSFLGITSLRANPAWPFISLLKRRIDSILFLPLYYKCTWHSWFPASTPSILKPFRVNSVLLIATTQKSCRNWCTYTIPAADCCSVQPFHPGLQGLYCKPYLMNQKTKKNQFHRKAKATFIEIYLIIESKFDYVVPLLLTCSSVNKRSV